MQKVPSFVDMAMSPKEATEASTPENDKPIYPYGLCICLTDEELDKIGLDGSCEIGDILHGHFLAEVKSVSKNDTASGTRTRVELQITHLSAENEEEENEEAEVKRPAASYKKMYNAE